MDYVVILLHKTVAVVGQDRLCIKTLAHYAGGIRVRLSGWRPLCLAQSGIN